MKNTLLILIVSAGTLHPVHAQRPLSTNDAFAAQQGSAPALCVDAAQTTPRRPVGLCLVAVCDAVPDDSKQGKGIAHLEQTNVIGTWTNADVNTRGLTRLIIAKKDDGLTIHAWGRCHPEDCDWGTVAFKVDAVPQGPGRLTGSARWEQPIALRCVTFTLSATNTLHVQRDTKYIDDSGRPDRTDVFLFLRAE